jgi:phosphoribosylformimino-5-aminoimidazole carboxamide ribotide isomerase
MKVIPVMDLLDKKVVHGIAGRRKEYKPIEDSVITSSAEPYTVALDFEKQLGLNSFYIADLNLIQKTPNQEINLEEVQNIASNSSFELMVDGGCSNKDDVAKILDLDVNHVIVGTETLASLTDLETIVDTFGGNKIILSVDFLGGELLANNTNLKKYTIESLIEKIDSLSLHAIIILELQKVGSQTGPMNNSLKAVIDTHPSTKIFTGGGVRSIQDIILLKESGISGALIATAFHKGKITRNDLESLV